MPGNFLFQFENIVQENCLKRASNGLLRFCFNFRHKVRNALFVALDKVTDYDGKSES